MVQSFSLERGKTWPGKHLGFLLQFKLADVLIVIKNNYTDLQEISLRKQSGWESFLWNSYILSSREHMKNYLVDYWEG